MTRYRVTMTPDSSEWPEDSRFFVAALHLGFQQTHTDPKKAFKAMECAAALGMAVSLEHLDDEEDEEGEK